jgi:hypothetical protein
MAHGKNLLACGLLVSVLAGALLATAGAAEGAKSVSLSNKSSEWWMPAEYLDGSMTFAVSGDTLTLTVRNQTSDPPEAFNIDRVFFSATSNVSGLQLLTAPTGWSLGFGENTKKADDFGYFDAVLTGSGSARVAPGQATIFTMKVLGTGGFSDSTFTTEKTTYGCTESLVAARFASTGECGSSVYGNGVASVSVAPVPEPATMGFLLMGTVVAYVNRRRRGARR